MQTSKKKKQITVIVGLVIHKEKILLVRRHEPEVIGAHLKWEFPGGKVDFGETPEEAVVREIREETGAIVKIKRLLPLAYTKNWEYPWGTQQTLLFAFECKYMKKAKRMPDHHVKEVRWVEVEKFKNYETLPGGKEFFACLMSR